MSKAVAFLAGLGAGYMKQEDKAAAEARQAELDDREKRKFDADMADRDQVKADRDALRAAAAPVAVADNMVKPDTMDNIDVGQPGEALSQDGYKVGAKTFAERGVADAAAAEQNTPASQRARIAAALSAQGNVVGADQLRTSGIQADAAQMALDKGKREEAAAVFDDGLRKAVAKGPDAIAEFMSDSHADGQAGAMKFKAVPTTDGKSWQMNRVGEDGTLTPFGGTFANDETGYTTAGFMLSQSVKPEAKLAHSLAMQEAERRGKHDEGQLKIAQQNADTAKQQANTQEQYRKDQAENMRQQRVLQAEHEKRLAKAGAAPGSPLQLTAKDMNDFDKEFNKRIDDEFNVKDAPDDTARKALTGQRAAKTALGNSIFQTNATLGSPLTAGTVLQAMEMAADRKNVRIVQVNGEDREAVIVNGQPVVTSGVLKKRPPAAPQDPWIRNAPPGGVTRPGAAAAAAQGVAPAEQPAAAGPNPYYDKSGRYVGRAAAPQGGGSLLTTSVIPAVKEGVSAVGDEMNNAGLDYLRAKISRGEPLSPAEQARAQRAGLTK